MPCARCCSRDFNAMLFSPQHRSPQPHRSSSLHCSAPLRAPATWQPDVDGRRRRRFSPFWAYCVSTSGGVAWAAVAAPSTKPRLLRLSQCTLPTALCTRCHAAPCEIHQVLRALTAERQHEHHCNVARDRQVLIRLNSASDHRHGATPLRPSRRRRRGACAGG